MTSRSTSSPYLAPELVLDALPDSPRLARRHVASALADALADMRDTAELVVTELVANAYLHAAPPIVVRIARCADGVRLEVSDAGRLPPMRTRPDADAATGRGLSLVNSLSTRWGVEPLAGGGKTVWAELARSDVSGAGIEPDLDALPASWIDEGATEPRYAVRLGAVPTQLLLSAKAHIDNVVRELSLMRTAEALTGVALPAPMAGLVRVATTDFVEARAAIKRQALESERRGDVFTELELALPLSAADAGVRYLAALDEADRHARAARLLTVAPPRSHKAFREWYVGALVDQLRAAARGQGPRAATPFPEMLAAELDRLSGLEESWKRLQLLQRTTAALTASASVDEIGAIVAGAAAEHAGVESARVYVATDRRTLRSVAWCGSSDDGDRYEELPLDADLPGPIVARSGEPLFMRSLAQIYDRFPELDGYYPSERSLHVVPVAIGARRLGLLALTFAAGAVADEAQLAFVQALADVLAQAVDRAQASERAEREREVNLRLLNAQLDALAEIVTGRPLEEAVSSLLLALESASGDDILASVLLLSDDGRHLLHCAAPSLPDSYNEAIGGVAIGPSVGSCGTAAYRRRRVIVEDIATDPLWDDFRDLALSAGLRACWSTPIVGARGQVLGTFAMYYREPHRPAARDLALIDMLVRTVALAIERSQADQERERALAAERAAALTLQESLLPDVPAEIGPLRLEARYRAGDPGVQVGGDWFDAVAVPGGTILVVGDVQGHDLQAAAVMGQLRTVARASAAEGQSPARILASVDHYLLGLGSELLATAVVVMLDERATTATTACAGHPAPLLMTRAGASWHSGDLAVGCGPPLGIGRSWQEQATALPPEAILLLYTDGLVENRSWPLDHGLALLQATLRAMPQGAGLSDVLDSALELVPTGSRGDDVAVLAASTPPA